MNSLLLLSLCAYLVVLVECQGPVFPMSYNVGSSSSTIRGKRHAEFLAHLTCPLSQEWCVYVKYVVDDLLYDDVVHTMPMICALGGRVLEHYQMLDYSGTEPKIIDFDYQPKVIIYHDCTVGQIVSEYEHSFEEQYRQTNCTGFEYTIDLLGKGSRATALRNVFGIYRVDHVVRDWPTEHYLQYPTRRSQYPEIPPWGVVPSSFPTERCLRMSDESGNSTTTTPVPTTVAITTEKITTFSDPKWIVNAFWESVDNVAKANSANSTLPA
ncbi:hypothetical protein CRE_31212 [Caenorhabditis remanei]|uniref:Uncharacterized protein n=1 Tax=Caenorhabditis remanei TaxID=31234 RepID=E3MLL5_CAERE|nr:hypothetical protein CRE_31212 [Caenorhabditis remanei]